MVENNAWTKFIDGDNTNKINYIILFFILVIGLSNEMFIGVFGNKLKNVVNRGYVKHSIMVLFLFLLLDINHTNTKNVLNPFLNILNATIIYALVLLLMHSNRLYIAFITIILVILIVLHKFKSHYEATINDQELLQGKLDLMYKTNNVFVIIIILTIVIGSLTTLNLNSLRKSLTH